MRKTSIALAAWLTLGWSAPLVQAQAEDQVQAGFADNLSSYMADKVTQSMLLDGVRAGDRMIVVGEHGHILSSDDVGQSWTQIDVPTRSALTGVAFADATHGFAVGHDSVILRTADGGQTWERVFFDPDYQTPLLHIWAPTPERAVAVGAYGYYLETLDGGDNWEQRTFKSEPLPSDDDTAGADAAVEEEDEYEDDWGDEEDYGEDYHLNQIVRAADGTLYIAGEAGSFYRSDDDGATWYRLDMPYEGSFFGALPLSGDSLLAFGMRGNLFRSDDRGGTFRKLETGVDALLTSGYVAADGTIVIVGLAGVILESSDGESFTLYRQSDRKGAMNALPADGGATVLVGEAGVNRLSREAYRSGGAQ